MKTTKNEISEYDTFLAKSSLPIKNIFYSVKKMITDIDDSLFEQINKSMLTIKKNIKTKPRGIVWLQPSVNYLIIYFAKDKYTSRIYEIFPNGFGGYPYIKVSSDNFDLEQIKILTIKALRKIENIL